MKTPAMAANHPGVMTSIGLNDEDLDTKGLCAHDAIQSSRLLPLVSSQLYILPSGRVRHARNPGATRTGEYAGRSLQQTSIWPFESRGRKPEMGKTKLTDIRELVRKARKANLMWTVISVYHVLRFIGPWDVLKALIRPRFTKPTTTGIKP